ncbi:MAG: histidine kinase [Bacteroidetes bacterium]|nr:histidine kinase [Bacteroidota bacterium]
MIKTKKRILILYGLIWALVFSAPYLRNMQDINSLDWERVVGDWTHLFFYFIVFLVNIYILVPKFLFRKKRSQYVIIVIGIILMVTIIDMLIHPGIAPPRIQGYGMPPEDVQPGLLAPHSLLPTFFNNLITGILIIGTGAAFELEYKWLSEEKLRKDIEKEQLKTNLALLRHQVSPHFFMNTLNNIHSLIEIDTEKAQDAVARLSTLMRYLLYDSAQNTIELKKEIEFINSFISLMKLRHSDEVEVTVVIPEQVPDTKIPPMLFISLLENAFKHGVNYPMKSYICFELQIIGNSLNCVIKNSKHKAAGNGQGEYSGIGLDNIKESLKLLYGDDFQLNILDKENEFEVDLKIPI